MPSFERPQYSSTLRKSILVSLFIVRYGMLVYFNYNVDRMTPEDHAILNSCTEKPLSAIARSRSRVSLTAPLAGNVSLYKCHSC